MAKPKLSLVGVGPRIPAPPGHLGATGTQLWADIQRDYAIIDPGELALLRTACEATDRVASVRDQIDATGELLVIRGFRGPILFARWSGTNGRR